MEKKEWVEPELEVIVRCRPEESVLMACKQTRYVCGDESGPTMTLASS